jgi:hypothetical protein
VLFVYLPQPAWLAKTKMLLLADVGVMVAVKPVSAKEDEVLVVVVL